MQNKLGARTLGARSRINEGKRGGWGEKWEYLLTDNQVINSKTEAHSNPLWIVGERANKSLYPSDQFFSGTKCSISSSVLPLVSGSANHSTSAETAQQMKQVKKIPCHPILSIMVGNSIDNSTIEK